MASVSLLLLFPVIVPNVAYSQSLPPTDPYVYVLVWSDHYSLLEPAISTYKQDLENDGFSVEIIAWPNLPSNAEGIRELLQSKASSHEMAGVLLVGDVPYAIYEMEILGYNYTFPCDQYYMDLDGNWTDSDGNGFYDRHGSGDGDLEPEIWVGRLYASTMTGNETELLVNYFDKNHRFRTGNLTLPRRAITYIDDPWVESADEVKGPLSMIYGNETTLVINPETTSATDYKNMLNDTLGYEWLHLMSHGNHKKHAFNTSEGWTYVYSSEVRSIDPHVFFCNLMACDTADYTGWNFSSSDYIGGSYIFADTYCLIVVGLTKPGSMSNFADFYEPIAKGKCIGQALKEWFEKNGELYPKHYYGLTILGDPTLRAPRVCDVAVTNVTASKNAVVQNSTMSINVTVENKGKGNFTETFNVTLYANTTFIGNMTVTNLQPLTTTILTFGWNTTGVAKGNYCISATVVLPVDNDPSDNIYTDCWVAVILKDDVAVTNVIPSNGRVVQNSTMSINVTVENKGNFTETFNVTAYANTSLIGTQKAITLTSRNSTSLTFMWNTTGFARSDYRVSATAVLPVDNDPSDNTYTDGWVAVTFVNDVAVTCIAAGDSLYGEIEVHSGWDVGINVTVRNEGISVETFNVTVYYDDEIIETQTVNLSPGADRILTFIWDTTGVPTCRNFTISAQASTVLGETETGDNTRVDGKIYVRLCGDVDGDDTVNTGDLIKIGRALWTNPGEPDYNPYADVDGDGEILTGDMIKAASHLWES